MYRALTYPSSGGQIVLSQHLVCIRWGLVDRLEDLDFADDLCLLSEAHRETQAKLGDLTEEAGKVGLAINAKKTKALRVNTKKQNHLCSGMKVLRIW